MKAKIIRGVGREVRNQLGLKDDVLWDEGTEQEMTGEQFKILSELNLAEAVKPGPPQPPK